MQLAGARGDGRARSDRRAFVADVALSVELKTLRNLSSPCSGMDFADEEMWANDNVDELSSAAESAEEDRRASLRASVGASSALRDDDAPSGVEVRNDAITDLEVERLREEIVQLMLARRDEEQSELAASLSDDDWGDDYFEMEQDYDSADESTEYYSVARDESSSQSGLSVEEVQPTQSLEEVEQAQRVGGSSTQVPESDEVIVLDDVASTQAEPSIRDNHAQNMTQDVNLTDSQIQERMRQLQEEMLKLSRLAQERNIPGMEREILVDAAERNGTRRYSAREPSPHRRTVRQCRVSVNRQSTLDEYMSNASEASDVTVTRVIPRSRAQPARTMDINDVREPQNVDELYKIWVETAASIIPAQCTVYNNFKLAFGDDSEAGLEYRRKEISRIGQLLFDFKSKKEPGQQAILKGREREGKTGALFSIALAALILRMRVVILCAPNKIAPVVDMVQKLRRAGFNSMFNVKHTLAKKTSIDHGIPSSESGQIFVAALGTKADLMKIKSYIDGERRGGHLTLTLVDECDELTQGKGHNSLKVPKNEDPDAYQAFIPLENRGEDDEDAPHVVPGSAQARQKSIKERIAAASHYFKEHIHPRTQIIACSATLTGYILNPIGVFRNDLITPIFSVFPKPGYVGIHKFKIQEGCALHGDGNMPLESFKNSPAVHTMLERFYNKKNVCDGVVLQPRDLNSRVEPVTLRGMLFISCHTAVNVHGGVDDFAVEVTRIVNGWGNAHDAAKTLFVCFVGKPRVFFAGKWLKMSAGASFEAIYNETARQARLGKFENVSLAKDEPLSQICTRCVLIGYSMTRRAMTAAFTPKDEPNALYKIQYGILTAPKFLTIDAVSQRVNRPSHEFALHEVPENFCIDVAMNPTTLRLCQFYRQLEDKMAADQREKPLIHSEFRRGINVFAYDLQDAKVSKRRISVETLSHTGEKEAQRMQLASVEEREDVRELMLKFNEWLTLQEYQPGKRYAEATARRFCEVAKSWFTGSARIEDVVEEARERVATAGFNSPDGPQFWNVDNPEQTKIRTSKLFIEFYGDLGVSMD